MRPQRPVDVFNFNSKPLSGGRQGLGPLGRLLDVANPLIGEVDQNNIGGHKSLLLLPLYPSRPSVSQGLAVRVTERWRSSPLRKIVSFTSLPASVPLMIRVNSLGLSTPAP